VVVRYFPGRVITATLSNARLKQTKLYIPLKEMKLSREIYGSITNRDMHLLNKEIKETIFKTMHLKISLKKHGNLYD
jgi:hypothetical protein